MSTLTVLSPWSLDGDEMPEHEIVLARGLHLPRNAVTQKFAFIARSGAGKTYAAGRLAEQFFNIKAQFIVLDPIGTWYGLRLNEQGTGPGLSIPVFGGLHADIPLHHESGKAVAKLLIEKKFSAVLDVSMLRKGQRKKFVTDFAEEFFTLKKTHKGPVHILIEEAHVFVPQRVQKGEERMLGAFEDLCRLGRNFGIGYSLISQRPQSIHKDVLNQIECLVALQTTGTHERKAMKEWIVTQGLVEKITDELPKLEIGEAYIWSPQWLKILGRYKILKKSTYDASATPEFDEEGPETVDFAKVDLSEIKEAMKELVDQAVLDDPKAQRKRIYDLEKEIRTLQSQLSVASAVEVTKEIPVIFEEDLKLLKRVEQSMNAVVGRIGQVEARETPQQVASVPRKVPRKIKPDPERAGWRESAGNGDLELREEREELTRKIKKGAREMLACLARLGGWMNRAQLAMQVGLKVQGSTFSSYLSSLRTSDFIEEQSINLKLSDAGEQFLRHIGEYPTRALTHEAVVAQWMGRFKKGAREMLRFLIDEYPRAVHREELAQIIGLACSGSTFSSYLSQLSISKVITKEFGGEVKASPNLWPEKAHA